MRIVLILLALVGCFPTVNCLPKSFNQTRTRSEYGKRLVNHGYKNTTEAVDPQHCLADCWAENYRCQSFNFFIRQKICELNDKSVNNTPAGDYITKEDVVYCTNPAHGRKNAPAVSKLTAFFRKTVKCEIIKYFPILSWRRCPVCRAHVQKWSPISKHCPNLTYFDLSLCFE